MTFEPVNPPFSKLAILGPGLLGGSIAMAVRERRLANHIAVWARRTEAAAEVNARSMADTASTDLAAVVSGADLIVFCTPVGVMQALAEQAAPHVAQGALITDVGSVKRRVVDALTPVFRVRGTFIGSHPMAGSELAGLEAAHADLFSGAACIVTPPETPADAALAQLVDFWRALGCRVETLPPDAHDEAVALVSHLPHVVAAALVDLVCAAKSNPLNFCGNGFRDTTRIASGSSGMWTEILTSNRAPLTQSIRGMIQKLEDVLHMVEQEQPDALTAFLQTAKTGRDALKRTTDDGSL